MKLYYAPGACSLSPHIAAREAGIELVLERVDLTTKKTTSGMDYTGINAKGYVPTLQLDSGELLTEGPAIVGFSAADAYLFVATNWAEYVKLDLSAFPNLPAFQKRIAVRPAVQSALRAEGLLH